jgi:hypothetical protein
MSEWETCQNLDECINGNRFGKGCVEDAIQSAMGGKPWHECHCGVDGDGNPPNRRQSDTITRLTAEVAEYEATFDAAWEADMRGVRMWREAHPGNDMVLPDRASFTAWILAEIMRLRSMAVVQESLIRRSEADNERLRAALRECEAELNAYYRMEYPGDHPYSQQELAQAMASNPATVALKENNDDQV